MERLILHPTETSQWYALVNEAQIATQIMLGENTESYLVFMLMRFSQNRCLVESIVALDFMNAHHVPKYRQVDLLQEVGDKSLLFCGFFPGIAKKRRVSINYFMNIGQSAYLSASEQQGSDKGELFYQLGRQFQDLSLILSSMRQNKMKETQKN